MKKITTILLLLVMGITQAQIINFTDSNFKARLLEANYNNDIANYSKIDTNNDGEIDLSEAEAVYMLDISSFNYPTTEIISNLDEISNFVNLINLNCSHNQLSSLNVQGLTNLNYLECSYNQLPSLNVQGLTNLIGLECSYNQLTSLNVQGLTNLNYLECGSNQLPSLNVQGLTNLHYLECGSNQLSTLNVQGLTNLTELGCGNNQLSSLNVQGLTNLLELYCYDNQLSSLNIQGLINLTKLDCAYNQIPSLNVQGLTNLSVLSCSFNQLPSLNVQGLTNLNYLDCSYNQLPSLNVQGLANLNYLECGSNQLPSLNVQGLSQLHFLDCSYNYQLTTLNVKCGNATWLYGPNNNNLYFYDNPNLQYICADDDDVAMVQQKITDYGYNNCHVNSYCSFTPGGAYYTINGSNRYDKNNNGCDALDSGYPNLKININDGTSNGGLITDETGHYFYNVQAGNYSMYPQLENPTYFVVSPATAVSTSFPIQASPFTQDYCISANGTHHDLEVTLIPVTVSRSGFDAVYIIKYKNKGTNTETASLNFTFDDSVSDYVSATTTPTVQNVGSLVWNLGNVAPFQNGEITLTLSLNSNLEIPPLNSGDVLHYTAQINGLFTDETPLDNTFNLPQTVVNSNDPNDKICLEGNTIDPNMIGQYVHYMIRFENTGTFPAQNIVVTDLIDETKFDVSTVQMVGASHSCYTKITGNKVEFIFQNINLPFVTNSNDGYVVFKIKTLGTVAIGDTVSNIANIYFDYNAPITTNTASSTFEALSNTDFDFRDYFSLSPVPAKTVLNIATKTDCVISSVSIYNTLGQLMLVSSNPRKTIDVSGLIKGTYFIKIVSDKGTSSASFSKE